MRNHARPSSSFNAAGRPATADRAGLNQCRGPGRAGPRVVQLDEARRETAPACRAIGTPASVNDVSPYSMRLGDTSGCFGQETRPPLRATYRPSYCIVCEPVSTLPPWWCRRRRGLDSSSYRGVKGTYIRYDVRQIYRRRNRSKNYPLQMLGIPILLR